MSMVVCFPFTRHILTSHAVDQGEQQANPGAKASYNASKAALHHYGNTLRAELKPFGVRVVTVISGEVGTNILKGDKKNGRKLPDGMSVITRRRSPSALSVLKYDC